MWFLRAQSGRRDGCGGTVPQMPLPWRLQGEVWGERWLWSLGVPAELQDPFSCDPKAPCPGTCGGHFGEAVPTPGQCVHATSRQRAQALRPQSHKPADVWPSTEVKMERPKRSPTNFESQAPLIGCHPAIAPLWPLPPTLTLRGAAGLWGTGEDALLMPVSYRSDRAGDNVESEVALGAKDPASLLAG